MKDGKHVESSNHQFILLLDDNFPFTPPSIHWQTPIFHPNFKPPSVCMGDHWYPGWSLSELCEVIIEMVQYKQFNIYDPLDKQAATWLENALEEQEISVPVDTREIRDLGFEMKRAD